MDNRVVDVEEIINELRREIKSRGMDDLADFDDFEDYSYSFSEETQLEEFNKDELYKEMELANATLVISPAVQLEGKGKFIKRVIRKLSYFVIRQLAASVTENNIHMVRALNQTRNYIFSRLAADKDVEEMKTIIISDLTSKITAQTSKIRQIAKENSELKQRLYSYTETAKAYEYDMKRANAEIDLLNIKLESLEQKYQLLLEQIK